MDPRRSIAAVVATIVVSTLMPQVKSAEMAGRQVVNVDQDWKFAKGSQPGAEKADFNDSAWQAVRLPHDWAISGPFNPSERRLRRQAALEGRGLVSQDVHARQGRRRSAACISISTA